jgi:hypothetical protein
MSARAQMQYDNYQKTTSLCYTGWGGEGGRWLLSTTVITVEQNARAWTPIMVNKRTRIDSTFLNYKYRYFH